MAALACTATVFEKLCLVVLSGYMMFESYTSTSLLWGSACREYLKAECAQVLMLSVPPSLGNVRVKYP